MAAMASAVRVTVVPPIVKERPLLKPSPQTKMTPAMIRFLDLVRSTLFSTRCAHRCRNHTVQHEADASDDRGRHGADECRYLRNEADNNRKDCGNTDDSRVMYAAQFQNAGVLAVRRVGRSADETCHCGCKTITEQGSMQARIRKEVSLLRLQRSPTYHRHAPSWSRSRSVP